MKTLYLECQSGISGDMTVAALLDLGAEEAALRSGLASLHVDGYRLQIGRVQKSGIDACDFDVILDSEQRQTHTDTHATGQGTLHGHGHAHGHSHTDEEGHSHDHGEAGHSHSHQHQAHSHTHDHQHRSLGDIVAIIQHSAITERAKAMAIKIFTVVAEAEAKVHGKPISQVHFHEVGAVDSIVDIVGAAILIDNLGIEKIICSPLREGCGTVKCQHGVMPVPAPATLEIVRSRGIPMQITDIPGELVTPTGAAIIAALAGGFGSPACMTVLKTGYGAGKRNYTHTANLLRASLIEEAAPTPAGDVVKLECNLDDMTGEELGYACEKLLEAGALDVWCTPILMKKGRPAQLLSVLAPAPQEQHFADLLLLHTSTIGVRASHHTRHVMDRRSAQLETRHGPVVVKECTKGELCKIQVEYESAKKLAGEKNLSINQIYRAAYHELEKGNLKD